MAQTLGLIEVIWRGVKITVEKGGTFQAGGLMNHAVITGKQVDFAQEMIAGKCTATKRLTRGETLSALWAAGQGELQVQCDTGQTFIVPDAFLTNTPSFTAGEGGKVPLEWAFGTVTEVANG